MANLLGTLKPNLAFARLLLAGLESPRMGGGGGGGGPVSDTGKPYRGNLGRDVIPGDVTGPPRSAGVPQRRLPRDCAGHPRGQGSRGLQRAFTAPCVCPTGSTRSRVQGQFGRGRNCRPSPGSDIRLRAPPTPEHIGPSSSLPLPLTQESQGCLLDLGPDYFFFWGS